MKTLHDLWKHVSYRYIFPGQLRFGVFFLNLFGNRAYARALACSLEYCREGTLGRAIWLFLRARNFELVPWYERHDLKHVLLGYPPYPPGEIRMQAFMFGNAGFSVVHTLIFLSFVIWTPEVWPELPYHYRVGQLTKPIGHWTVEQYADRDLEELRLEIGLEAARRQATEAWMRLFLGSAAAGSSEYV